MAANERILLADCQRVADELGDLLRPPVKLTVAVEQERPRTRSKDQPLQFSATARITSARESHQRPVQADSIGTSAEEALGFLKAALELKTRFLRSGRSGARGQAAPE